MKHITITYKTGKQISFDAKEIFYKVEWGWLREIGFVPVGKNRKKWFPIGGRRDSNNDYTGTNVLIEEI